MSRRKHSGEVSVGSDSFLDVIANIVGILIILIVVAGIQAGKPPILKKTRRAKTKGEAVAKATVLNKSPVKQSPLAEQKDESAPLEPVLAAEPEEPEEPRFAEAAEPPPDLEQRMKDLKGEIESLETAANANQAALRELERQQASGELEFTTGKDKLIREKSKLDSSVKSVEQVRALVDSQHTSLDLLKSQLEEERKRPPKVKAIKHEVTPISKTVSNEQIHVRLHKNKISVVPIHDLLEAAMRQAKKRGPELATGKSSYGTVGPIKGYSLEFKMIAEPASTAERARGGPGLYRISLASFRLDPESELQEESVEDALRRGSMFDIAVQTAVPGATFTLWTYPESFSSYRPIQSRLHELGYVVAGRPLPVGIPISFSPEGSASAGQ
jgi:hypothetical protein